MIFGKFQDKICAPEVYYYAQQAANKTDRRRINLPDPHEVQNCLNGHGQCKTYEDYPFDGLGHIFDLAISVIMEDVRRFARHFYRVIKKDRNTEGYE
jgi:hypothetical protein